MLPEWLGGAHRTILLVFPKSMKPAAVSGDRHTHEANAIRVEERAVSVVRIDDDESRAVELEMALQQVQHPFPDRAEPDHDEGPVILP